MGAPSKPNRAWSAATSQSDVKKSLLTFGGGKNLEDPRGRSVNVDGQNY
jgi:hypothetical protein